jgi:hypothetical protein
MLVSKLSLNQSFIYRLRRWKRTAFWWSFRVINRVYTRIFFHELSRSRDLSRSRESRRAFEDILFQNPAIASLDKQRNYFILQASFGDKWCILSFLGIHLALYPSSLVIACHQDLELIEIFLGPALTAERFIFIDQLELNHLSEFFRPVSLASMPLADISFTDRCKMLVTSFFIDHGLPPGTIRHLHIVRYPYFNELYSLHGVSYATLLKILLYLPASAKSVLPAYYNERDRAAAKDIASRVYSSGGDSAMLPAILVNVVNFSQAALSASQISFLVSTLEACGYRVLLNVSQCADSQELASLLASRDCQAVHVSIPSALLALVCDSVHAVIGVLGGAMNVAVQFSKAHVLSLQTPAMFTGCSEDELFGEWGKERIWKWVDRDWPCLYPGRLVVNRFIGDPSAISTELLAHVLHSFLRQLPHPSSSQTTLQ